MMRLYLERLEHRVTTPVAAGDEEDCYTAHGLKRGVYLTEQELSGRGVESCEVDPDLVAPYEVTGDGDAHRSFVVPGAVAKELTFR